MDARKFTDYSTPGLMVADLSFNDLITLAEHNGHDRENVATVEPLGQRGMHGLWRVYCYRECRCARRLLRKQHRKHRGKGKNGRRKR